MIPGILMGLGEPQSMASHKVEDNFLWGELTPPGTMIFYFTLLRVVQGEKI